MTVEQAGLTVLDQEPGWMTRSDGKAEAVRYWLRHGDGFSGWIVRSTVDRHSYSDPIPNKREAKAALLSWDLGEVSS